METAPLVADPSGELGKPELSAISSIHRASARKESSKRKGSCGKSLLRTFPCLAYLSRAYQWHKEKDKLNSWLRTHVRVFPFFVRVRKRRREGYLIVRRRMASSALMLLLRNRKYSR